MKTAPILMFLVLGVALQAAQSSASDGSSSSATNTGTAYVIPIKGEINSSLVYVVRRTVSQAEREGASIVIFEMHTPGGEVRAAEEIMHIISGIKTKSYTFVNRHALSAGAFIALATDHIYMADGGRIGAAAPILMTPFGTPVDMPSNITAKITSDLSALLRWVTQKKGYDTKLAEAMISEVGYEIGDKVICPPGQLLTLTSHEAEQLVDDGGNKHPLLSSGTVKDVDDLLSRIGCPRHRVRIVEITGAEKIARFLDTFAVKGLLLGLGLFLLYLEFKTPGFGFPGVAGIILLAFWFWGCHIAGLAGLEEIVLFVIGLILLGLEVFFFPTLGILGILGVLLMLASVMMAMVEHYPSDPWYRVPEFQLRGMVVSTGVSLIIAFILGTLLTRFLPQTRAFRYIGLAKVLTADEKHGPAGGAANLVGLAGVAVTQLRPAGIGDFGKYRMDVVTRGDYIAEGDPIVIAEIHGNRIVVEKKPGPKSA